MSTFTLRVTWSSGAVYQYPYHLGTDEDVAREAATDIHRRWRDQFGDRTKLKSELISPDGRVIALRTTPEATFARPGGRR